MSCERNAKNVTVTDCRCLETKSLITGGLRYSLIIWGSKTIHELPKYGRTSRLCDGARVCGPNVFYNCTASQTLPI